MAQASANNKCVFGNVIFVSVYGIVQHFTGVVPTEAWVDNDAFPELKTRVISTLVNPNILGGYLVLVISLITGLLSTSKEKMWQLVLGSGILIAGLCLLYTYSRGNWVALAVGLLLFCVCFCRRALLPLIGIGILGMWFARGAVWHRIISIFGTEVLLLLLDLPIWKVRYLLLKNIRGVLAGMDISLFIRNMIFILTILTSLCIIVIIYY